MLQKCPKVERAILISMAGWDWNCPQHIPVRYSQAQVKTMLTLLQERIAQLEEQLGLRSSGGRM